MSAAVDVEAVRRACMADLGRSRLDQLPLSDREVNGPSFRPSRDGLAMRFAPQVRDALKSKWNVTIQDEESEQIEGLANDDARPWAVKAAHIPTKPAPLRASMPAKASDKTVTGHLGRYAVSTPTGRQQPNGKPQTGKPQTGKPQTGKPQTSKPQLTEPRPAAARPATLVEDVLCSGTCNMTTSDGAQEAIVGFSMFINVETDCAFLALTLPGGERRVYNVLDLQAPVQKKHRCIVTARPGKGDFHYGLKLENDEHTAKFRGYLENLRVAALREQSLVMPSSVPEPAREQQPVKQADTNTSALEDLIGLEIAPPAPGDIIKEECESATTAVEPPDHLGEFLQRTLNDFSGLSLQNIEDSARGIDDQAIQLWINRSCVETEWDNMKADVLDFIRALRRIEKKLEASRAGDTPSEASHEPVRKRQAERSLERVQYTAAEMKSLKSKASPCPDLRGKVDFSSGTSTPKAASTDTPKAAITVERSRLPSLSKCREWLLGSTVETKDVSKEESVTPVQDCAESAELMEIDTIPAPIVQPVPVAAPVAVSVLGGQTPGLKTSRWAS
ncbi:hypothetical protein XA68_14005 [Ophiocordyceps unilateralis]|uniref:Uncharacterized protein n=1 Tax=Ophiocordyceps unilateralis TaxID=268505 RepID=A0A2A9PBN6_OPHUN|nr:hypothetical protein XA68_14005 [Ophiocordyceps unilateralis]